MERPHRLERSAYRGPVTVAFTCCVAERRPLFADRAVTGQFAGMLGHEADRSGCDVLAHVFMADHLHVLLRGRDAESDAWLAMTRFKQQSGYWLSRNGNPWRWQRDFYDHVIRDPRDEERQTIYILQNPLRAGLSGHWCEYPWIGPSARGP